MMNDSKYYTLTEAAAEGFRLGEESAAEAANKIIERLESDFNSALEDANRLQLENKRLREELQESEETLRRANRFIAQKQEEIAALRGDDDG